MELYTRSRNNRFVIDEDFIPKATIDGESHEMLTLIAGVSGAVAAFVILAVLMTFIGRNKPQRPMKPAAPSALANQLESSTTITTERFHNKYPLVLRLDGIGGGEKKTVNFSPQILSVDNLQLGEFNKAFTAEPHCNSQIGKSNISLKERERNLTVPFIIVQKF